MKNKTLQLISAVILLGASSFAQTLLTNTTLSAAVADSKTQTVVVASATGINAPSASDYTKATFLFVDRELMDVRSVSGTILTVVRGVGGTKAFPHASGAYVFVVPAYQATGMSSTPSGSCTRGQGQALYLPVIVPGSPAPFYDCLNGQWVNGDADGSTRLQANGMRYPDPGATALTALETAGTAAGAATEIYCMEIDLPYSGMLTGLGVLNGTTVGTNKHFAILYDAGGNVLANSATAGTTTANASTYQKLNFVNKYYAVGPARYFACDGLNGTTDTIRHAVTAVNDNVLGGTITGQTFGTAAAITAPSSFTTAKVPYFLIY